MKRTNVEAILATFVFVFASSACGTKRELTQSESAQASKHNTIFGSTPETAALLDIYRKAAKSGNLYCPNGGECEQALSMISVVTEDGIERCTGFLISENEVMTNDHCVNKSISLKGWESRRTNIPCRNFIYTHFIGESSTSPGKTVGCESIEVRSGETGVASQDYAIIKLQSRVVDRAPLKLSPRGFRNAEKASVFRVQMTSDETQTGFHGMQSKLNCHATFATFLFQSILSPESILMTFGDCDIQAGNSGSPAINEDGTVGAIIQGYLNFTQASAVGQTLRRHLIDQYFGEVGIGSQLLCMQGIPGISASRCEPVNVSSNLMPEDYLEKFGDNFQQNLPATDPTHEWKEILPSPSSFRRTFVSVPLCTGDLGFEANAISFEKGLNRYMKPEWKAQNEMGERHPAFHSGPGDRVFTNDELGSIAVPACH